MPDRIRNCRKLRLRFSRVGVDKFCDTLHIGYHAIDSKDALLNECGKYVLALIDFHLIYTRFQQVHRGIVSAGDC